MYMNKVWGTIKKWFLPPMRMQEDEWEYMGHVNMGNNEHGLYCLNYYRHKDGRMADTGPRHCSDPELKEFFIRQQKEIQMIENFKRNYDLFFISIFGLLVLQAGLDVVDKGLWVVISLLGVLGAFTAGTILSIGYRESRYLVLTGILLSFASHWLISYGKFSSLSIYPINISIFWLSLSIGIIRSKIMDILDFL